MSVKPSKFVRPLLTFCGMLLLGEAVSSMYAFKGGEPPPVVCCLRISYVSNYRSCLETVFGPWLAAHLTWF
jgi:hypothetical protein